ncbi:MAG: hypothetical protein ACREFI_05915 [Stellaceae bacterium]
MKVPALAAILVCLGFAPPAMAAAEPWHDFHLPGTDFVVSTPGQPKIIEDGVDRDGVVAKTAQLKLGDADYSITHTVYPRGYVSRGTAVIDLLNHARDGLAASVSGHVAGERRFTLGDAQASEFTIDVPPTPGDPKRQTAKVRVYVRVVGASVTVDQCVALAPRGSEASAGAERFLESIRFARD